MKKHKKFCPKCGTPNDVSDLYCVHCGYSFKRKKEGLNLKSIIFVIILLLAAWAVIRILLKKPIIPQELIGWFDTLKNMTASKAG